MGQKTNPIGLRLGIIKSWESRWFSEKNYSDLLQEDINLRKFLQKRLSSAGISKIVIERPAKLANIILYTSRNMRSFQGNIGLINKYTSRILHEWLESKGIPYDELHFGKPWGNGNLNYIDDKLISIPEFITDQKN